MPSRQIGKNTEYVSQRDFLRLLNVEFDSRCKTPNSVKMTRMGGEGNDEARCSYGKFCDYACPMRRGQVEKF